MASFLNQKLGTAFGQGVHALNQSVHTELRVGNHTVLVKERLAEGGFGFVDLVTEVNTQKDFVLKRCNVDRDEAFATVKKEINILQRYAGKYIVTLVDQDIITKNRTSREALLLLEHCPGGHLLDRLNERQGSHLPVDTVYRIFGQLLLALKPMHESNPPITHRDLKLENILFGQDGKLKLIDFGSCVEGPVYMRNPKEREAAEEIIAKETTQMYRAPEMCDTYMRQVLTEKTDIWALGCILYALCFLVHPFQNAGSLGILSAKITFPANSPFSEDTHALILKMLDVDPEARWSIKELVEGTSALAGGRPLPEVPLSEEAVKRREERIAANTLRESKNQKKAVAAPPPRKAVPLDSNSVAAKRLAAKRGVASVGVPNSSAKAAGNTDWFDDSASSPAPAASSSVAVDFAADFDAAPAVFAKQPSGTFASNADDLFDDFGASSSAFDDFPSNASSSTSQAHGSVRRPSFGADEPPPIKPAKNNKISNAASLFDEVEEEVDPAVVNAAFAPSSSSSEVPQFSSGGGFDAFSDAPAPASDGFDAFGDSNASFDAFGSSSAPAAAAADAFEPSTFASSSGADAFATRGSFTASTAATGGFDAFGNDDFTASQSNDGSDPFGSSAPPPKPARKPSVVTAKQPKPLPPTPAAPAFSLLDVSEAEEEVPAQSVNRSNSGHVVADLFAATDMLSPASAPSFSGSNSNRNSFTSSGPPTFTDDLLIPAAAPAPSAATAPNRNSLPRDPNAVLSLFDMPKPEKPPKPVMLNTPPVMMMSPSPAFGPGGGAGGGPPRGGMGMMTPPGPGGMMMGSPMGGAAGGPAMMGSGGSGAYIPDPMRGGPRPPQFGMASPMGMPPQQGGFGMQQQPSPQQRPLQMGGGSTGMMQQPAFQTQKTVDPFDSINQFAPMKRK